MTDKEYLKKYLKPSELEEGLKKLNQNIPVQYIVGNVDFYDLNFEVNENVLIPRFETEELVQKTIDYINEFFQREVSILDIGTGSGCIAITLKKHLTSKVDAVDISDLSIEMALKNAKKNNVDINIYCSDIFSNVNNKYDVIISNPPYISYDETIMDIVKDNEPNIALYAPNDGLYFYEQILKQACNYLNNKFLIAFEIGHNQGKKIKEMALNYFPNSKILLEKDLQNRNRFIFIFKDK